MTLNILWFLLQVDIKESKSAVKRALLWEVSDKYVTVFKEHYLW